MQQTWSNQLATQIGNCSRRLFHLLCCFSWFWVLRLIIHLMYQRYCVVQISPMQDEGTRAGTRGACKEKLRILSNEKSLAVKLTVCLKNCIIILMLEHKCREVLRSRFHYLNSKTKSQFHLMYLLFVHTTIIHNHSDALVGLICLIFGGRAILFFRKFFPQQALPCSALWRLTFHVILATVIVVLIIFRT